MDPLGLLIAIVVTALVLATLKQLLFPSRFVRMVSKIPGPKPAPFFGNILEMARVPPKKLISFWIENYKRYGSLSRSWLLSNNAFVHFQSPEAVEVLIGGMKHTEKHVLYEILHPWLGQGLLTSKRAKWQKHRKMITPTFHFKILKTFMEVIVDKSDILVSVLNEASEKSKVFNVFPLITNATLDIICETAMGTNINAQGMAENDYVSAIHSLSELIIERILRPWLYFDVIYKFTAMGKQWAGALAILHGFTDRVIKERRDARKSKRVYVPVLNDEDIILGGKRRVAFLDLLLDVADKDPTLTDVDIRDEVDTFMFEGHDTTTAGISWTVYLLGYHPEIQERVYKEIKDILNGEDRQITFQDVNEMNYLERVIKESMRLYPPVPSFGRKIEEDIIVNGYTIPAGAYAECRTYVMHRNAEYFPNPDVFNPDNFLPEVAKTRHPYAYIPFSAGPRNCIGQKFAMIVEKTVLATVLRNFKIKSIDKPEDVALVAELILRPLNGINITLEKRSF